jgi:hypothetical protein
MDSSRLITNTLGDQMRIGVSAVITALLALGPHRALAAQFNLNPSDPQTANWTLATTVTFTIPIKLTQLSPDLQKVRAVCVVMGGGFSSAATPLFSNSNLLNWLANAEMMVLAGQVVATLSVTVPIWAELLEDPIGKTAEYRCGLQGFSKSLLRWDSFSETSTVQGLLLKPTPPPIQGPFKW